MDYHEQDKRPGKLKCDPHLRCKYIAKQYAKSHFGIT